MQPGGGAKKSNQARCLLAYSARSGASPFIMPPTRRAAPVAKSEPIHSAGDRGGCRITAELFDEVNSFLCTIPGAGVPPLRRDYSFRLIRRPGPAVAPYAPPPGGIPAIAWPIARTQPLPQSILRH